MPLNSTDPLPRCLAPDYISEAVIELRFDPGVPPAAIFGILYSRLRSQYPQLQELPVLQLPEAIRNADPSLTIQPHYRLEGGPFRVQIGPAVISVVASAPYPGWAEFAKRTKGVFDLIFELGIARAVKRFGMRYINGYPFDVMPKLDIEFFMAGQKYESGSMYFRTAIETAGFRSLIQVGNDLSSVGSIHDGAASIVDVDTVLIEGKADFHQAIPALLEDAHAVTKRVFFSMLRKDFILEMKPTY